MEPKQIEGSRRDEVLRCSTLSLMIWLREGRIRIAVGKHGDFVSLSDR